MLDVSFSFPFFRMVLDIMIYNVYCKLLGDLLVIASAFQIAGGLKKSIREYLYFEMKLMWITLQS